jgi:hypothetical protein
MRDARLLRRGLRRVGPGRVSRFVWSLHRTRRRRGSRPIDRSLDRYLLATADCWWRYRRGLPVLLRIRTGVPPLAPTVLPARIVPRTGAVSLGGAGGDRRDGAAGRVGRACSRWLLVTLGLSRSDRELRWHPPADSRPGGGRCWSPGHGERRLCQPRRTHGLSGRRLWGRRGKQCGSDGPWTDRRQISRRGRACPSARASWHQGCRCHHAELLIRGYRTE